MTKEELVDALQKLANDSGEVAKALKEHWPEESHAEELAGASYVMLDWADNILEGIKQND